MEKKPYSFNSRILRVSRVIFISMIIISIIGFFLMFETYNIYLQVWIVNNAHSTSPINPIIPTHPFSSSIPYSNILTTNIIPILFIPLVFIALTNLILVQTKKLVMKKEIYNLFQSIGLQQTDSLTAIITLDHNEQLIIKANYEGNFTVIKENYSLPYVSGDELLWKIYYLQFKNSKKT